MIGVEGLSKRFGDIRAVDGVSFQVREGEIYGLLGPNGAGKTTTLNMLAGLLPPDAGRIVYGGVDLAADSLAVKHRLGVVPQEVAIYEGLTARENLRFWGGLYDLAGAELKRAVDEALERVGLTSRADDKVKEYSGGMKRRLNLSLGLVHGPEFVLMDEPTAGIDPQARQNILDVVRSIASGGATVLYTTHYLEEAEMLCDRIGIMDHGRILAEGTLDELTRLLGAGDLITVRGSFEADDVRRRLRDFDNVEIVDIQADRLLLAAPGDSRGAVRVLGQILEGALDIDAVSIQPPSLNSLFLKLTGRELRD